LCAAGIQTTNAAGHFLHSDTLDQVEWLVKKIQSLPQNLSSTIVSFFLADDMSDWEEYNFEKAKYLLEQADGSILPYVNQVRAEGEPESLVRVPTPIFAPESYGTRDLGKPPWAKNQNNPTLVRLPFLLSPFVRMLCSLSHCTACGCPFCCFPYRIQSICCRRS
jgi:hypothetical protein